MKKIIVLATSLLIASISFGQKAVTGASSALDQKKLVASKRCAIAGVIRDNHNFPLKSVRTFIYQADSTIIASGFTNAEGRYETNSLPPGTYTVKIMYPSQVANVITDVILKPGITPINIKGEIPTADLSTPYADVASKPAQVEKKKGNK